MAVYLLLFFILIIVWLCIYAQNDEKRYRWENFCCIAATFLFVLFSALRGKTVGADTVDYVRDYSVFAQYSYRKIFEIYGDNPGYYFLSKFAANMGVSLQLWFGIVALLYVGTVSKLISKYSTDKAFSYIMFLALGYYAFSLAGLKQTLAMTCTIWAFICLLEKKYVRFALLIIIASVFHLSSLIYILALGIWLIRKMKYFYSIMVAVFILFAINYVWIFNLIMSIIDNEHYNSYIGVEETYSPTVLLVQLAIIVTCLILVKWFEHSNDEDTRVFFGMACLGAMIQMFAFVVASSFRASMYYSLFGFILLPKCLELQRDTVYRRGWKMGLAAIFILYFIYTNRDGSSIVPYMFYWN